MKKSGMVVVVVFMSNLLISLSSSAQEVPGGPDGVPVALMNSSIQVLVQPFLTNSGSNVDISTPNPQREELIQAAANDGADVLNGGEASPLLLQVETGMRAALAKGGNKAAYSDSDLAHMIISQADY